MGYLLIWWVVYCLSRWQLCLQMSSWTIFVLFCLFLFYQFEMLFMVDNTDLLAKMTMLTLVLILILILTLLVTDVMVDVDIERQWWVKLHSSRWLWLLHLGDGPTTSNWILEVPKYHVPESPRIICGVCEKLHQKPRLKHFACDFSSSQ